MNRAGRASITALVISALSLVTIGTPACSAGSQSPAALPSSPQSPSDHDQRVIARLEDLKTLREGLAREHADPFFRTPKADFSAAADALASRAADLSDDAWIVELAKLTALIGDAHTRLVLVAGKSPCQTSSTIRFAALADGFFVDAAPTDHLDLLGARLVGINDIPIDDVSRRLRTFMASETDADARLVAAAYLKYDHVLHALGILSTPGTVTYTFCGGRSTTGNPASDISAPRRVAFTPIPDESSWSGAVLPDPRATPLPPGRQTRKAFYWHEFVDDGRLLLCRYDRCADMDGKSVSAWADEVIADANARSPRAIAIDLRRNAGGNSGLLHPLINLLRTWKKGDQTRRVYAIIGPATFSSGVTNALDLRAYAGAILVGEEPGQATGSFGEVRRLRLPNCGLDVSYATTRRDDPSAPIPVNIDVPAPMTSDAYFAARDPAVEAITSSR